MTNWIDSHCHVHSMADPDAILDRAREVGVEAVVCVGTDLETSRAAVELAAARSDVLATVGLHPHDASLLDAQRGQIEALAANPDVVGVGEAGFDLHYNHSPFEAQEQAFRWQIGLARVLNRTLVIHTREAWDDTFRVLADEGVPERTVFHCFTGGPDEARRVLDLGAFLSFSGIVTFPGADDVRAAAYLAPAERILIETDSPYLTPVPHRGHTNEPAFVAHVGAAVAAARKTDIDEFAEQTRANTRVAFPPPGRTPSNM